MLKLAFSLLIMGLSVGCSRESGSSTGTSAPDSPATDQTDASRASDSDVATASDRATSGQPSPTPASPPVPQRAVDLDSKELAIALDELTQAVRKYSFERRRLPKTFNEVVAAGYMKNVPQAPPGRKFEIDPKTVQVVLVKQ
jgi:hypothetical protein